MEPAFDFRPDLLRHSHDFAFFSGFPSSSTGMNLRCTSASYISSEQSGGTIQISLLKGERKRRVWTIGSLSNVPHLFREIVIDEDRVTGLADGPAEHDVLADVATLFVHPVEEPRTWQTGEDRRRLHQYEAESNFVNPFEPR